MPEDTKALKLEMKRLSAKFAEIEAEKKRAAGPVRFDTKKQRSNRLKELLPSVEVYQPRQALSAAFQERLEHTTLSELARSTLSCYDFPWGGGSAVSSNWMAPIFTTDVPERDEFLLQTKALLLRSVGRLPPLPEQNAILVKGPVGSGKTTLGLLMALSIAALKMNSVVVRFDCVGDLSFTTFSPIVAASLLKAGMVTEKEAIDAATSLPALRELAMTRFANVVFFVDEAQLMFSASNSLLHLPGRAKSRAEMIAEEISSFERFWPFSILTGSSSSLSNLLFNPDLTPLSVFPSKITRPVNNTKFKQAPVHRLRDSHSIERVTADLERTFQLSVLAQRDPDVERNPASGFPDATSQMNRDWLVKHIDDLTDGPVIRRAEETRKRAISFLRRFLSDRIEDERMLLFVALLYSRGIPRVLKDLVTEGGKHVLRTQDFIPPRVRALWRSMARYLLLEPDPEFQEKLQTKVRELGEVLHPSEGAFNLIRSEELALLRIHIPLLFSTVPEAVVGFPERATLMEWVDRGYILWNEDAQLISFTSVADFALTRLSVAMQVDHVELLALLFNQLGEEHERIAVSSIAEAAADRFTDPRVRGLLDRIGLVPSQTQALSAKVVVLKNTTTLAFPSVKRFRTTVRDLQFELEPRRPTKKESAAKAPDDLVSSSDEEAGSMNSGSGDTPTLPLVPPPGFRVRVVDPRFPPKMSTINILLHEAKQLCYGSVVKARLQATQTPRPSVHLHDEYIGIPDGSLLHHFATYESLPEQTIHSAFNINQRSFPVLFKPSPDHFRIGWILLNPDASLSVIQMKHGESSIDEEETTVELSAGAMVLRAWLGNQGVREWRTTPIRRVVWSLRPTVEGTFVKKERIETGRFAAAFGVDWLDKFAIAPVWSAEVVQVLFHAFKEETWGVVGEKERASVNLKSNLELSSLIRDAMPSE